MATPFGTNLSWLNLREETTLASSKILTATSGDLNYTLDAHTLA